MTARTTLGVLASILALATYAPIASAQELTDRAPRVAGGLALGLGGELDTYFNDTHVENDLDASVGFDLRGEVPVLDFLVVGGFFQFMSVEPDISSWEREETFSFDAYVRARWVFEVVPQTFFIEPYVLLPIGLTLAVLPDDDGTGDDTWPGWNTAALIGAQFLHASGAGAYVEIGWRHAEAYMETTVPLFGTVDTSHVTNELALNLGFVYAFDVR